MCDISNKLNKSEIQNYCLKEEVGYRGGLKACSLS